MFLEEDFRGSTLLHTWDVRLKIIGFIALIFSFSFIKNIKLVPLMMVLSVILWIISKVPFYFLVRRWRIASLFILMMDLIYLFFSKGDALFHIGFLNITYMGFINSILITTRALCILTLVSILFATTSYVDIVKGMGELGLPVILTDMFLFTYRYIFEVGSNLEKMQRAMGLRGFKGKKIKDIGKISSLVGAVFVRSYGQADRIYNAMILRGYGENQVMKKVSLESKQDKILLGIFIFFALGIMLLQIYLDVFGG